MNKTLLKTTNKHYPVRANDVDVKDTNGSFDKPFKLEHSKVDEGM